MKKLFISFLTSVATLSAIAGGNALQSTAATQGHDDPLDNGFILRAGISLPSAGYGFASDEKDLVKEFTPKLGLGLEIGNQWYVFRTNAENMGVAINVNWFDLALATKSNSSGGVDVTTAVFTGSFIEVGPMFTYKVTDDIGVDLFYNLKPTFMVSAMTSSSNGNDFSQALSGFGFNNAVGTSFRWRALSLGFEYVFGTIKASNINSDDKSADVPNNYKMNTNAFKINIGAKF